jgi:thiol-disulfide isomerase/thioredoxin
MNKNFIELTRDNLSNFITAPKLLVIYGSRGCGACKRMKPKLKSISELLPMVYVETPMFPRATQLYPEPIKYYPTVVLFGGGYYKATIDNHTIWFDIEKIIKNEYL